VVEPFDKRKFKEFLVKEGQFLLPVVSAIQDARQAIDEVIDVVAGAAVKGDVAQNLQFSFSRFKVTSMGRNVISEMVLHFVRDVLSE
jgi:uncharacterized protein YybS (DUF2232 family)